MSNPSIHFGIQMTGGGHITRGRALGGALKERGAKMSYLFSGGDETKLHDAAFFEKRAFAKGISFAIKDGKIQIARSIYTGLKDLKPLWDEAANIDMQGFDHVISDYEPVTTRAAERNGLESIGVTHQNAFLYNVPGARDLRMQFFTRVYAPVTNPVGIHWDTFDHPLIPPMIERFEPAAEPDPSKIVVYTWVENLKNLTKVFNQFGLYRFHIYTPEVTKPVEIGNCILKPTSRDGSFARDVSESAGVISNAGFEGPSEWLNAGKKILVKPLGGQPEQEANAAALVKLGYGDSTYVFDAQSIGKWLQKDHAVQVQWPDVSGAVADWVMGGAKRSRVIDLSNNLWREVKFKHLDIQQP